jgi:hypothetical protein
VNEYVHHLPLGGGGQIKTRSGLNAGGAALAEGNQSGH